MTKPAFRLAAFAAAAGVLATAAAARQEAPRVGAPAPLFTLPAANGSGAVALADLLGKSKAVVIVFDSARCPYARGFKGRMAAMGKEYGAKGVAFVTIDSNKDEPAAEVAEDAKKHGFTFPVLKDDGNKVADLYAARKTPEVFVLDPKGVLVYHGRIDETYDEPERVRSPDLRNALDAILLGKPVPRVETKAFGCTIKRV